MGLGILCGRTQVEQVREDNNNFGLFVLSLWKKMT